MVKLTFLPSFTQLVLPNG